MLYRAEAIKRANGVHFPEEVVTIAAELLLSLFLLFFYYTYIYIYIYIYLIVDLVQMCRAWAKDARTKCIEAFVLKA